MQVFYAGVDYPHKKGEFCKRKSFDAYGLFYFSTPFLYESQGVMHRGSAGDVIIIKPGDIVYHGPVSQQQSFVNDWMYVSDDLSSVLEKYPVPCSACIKIGRNKIVNLAVKEIKNEQLFKYEGYQDKIDCIINQMMIDIYRIYKKSVSDSSLSQIEIARNKIMQSYSKEWTLEEMAKAAGYSPSRFSALYTKRYGLSPKADLLKERLNIAKQMLIYSQLSVGETARQCGFQSLYYFSNYFKKNVGLSPREFAKKHGEDNIF
ncbi:MAG: helix-turn-helix transcriptional regulator [Oscillospiraceae bacterium]|nr:helix-turn-helix transcriptional regulator [Oscillospiraceae bacterium]